jgi:hypothetical protein
MQPPIHRRVLTLEERELLARAHAIKARVRKENKKLRPAKVQPAAEGQRRPRVRCADHLGFIHEVGLCVACEIEGAPDTKSEPNPLEAAHQKLAIASKGWTGSGKGVRSDDEKSVGLCRWHHQLAPNACDKGQRKFWDRLNIGDRIADLCAALVAARPDAVAGRAVVRRFAVEARAVEPRPRPTQAGRTSPKARLQGRGFSQTHTKKLDGSVVRKETRHG